MKTHVVLITAKTNIHVGNENGGEFTIIDKAIQRDVLTGLPCINSSSLKGAINEYCCYQTNMKPEIRNIIFGSDKMNKNDKSQKGEAIFFDAKLLFLPQQDEKDLFHHVTTNDILKMMEDRVKLFDPSFKLNEKDLKGKGVEIIENEKMSSLCDNDNLPIIARNKLENGLSDNLWYEQVLPAETVFYTIIQEGDDENLKSYLNNKIVQIGANATIGYGYCNFRFID